VLWLVGSGLPLRPWDPVTYATVAATFIAKMKAVDPTIKIGVVGEVSEDALDYRSPIHNVVNPRTSATHHGWTPVMLDKFRNLGVTPDFLIYHRYEQAPVPKRRNAPDGSRTGGQPDEPVLGRGCRGIATGTERLPQCRTAANVEWSSPRTIPSTPTRASNRRALSTGSTSLTASRMCSRPNSTPLSGGTSATVRDSNTTPPNAVNLSPSLYGWRLYGDYGILPPEPAVGSPNYNDAYPTYYVFKLLSHFARGGTPLSERQAIPPWSRHTRPPCRRLVACW